MRRLFKDGKIELTDVAAWLVEWAYSAVKVGELLRKRVLEAKDEEMTAVKTLGGCLC